MSFTPRTSSTNPTDIFDSNSIYNSNYYVGYNGHIEDHTINTYQCTYYALARTGEIAGEPVARFSWNPDYNPSHLIWNRYGYGDAYQWISDTLWDTSRSAYDVQLGDIVCFDTQYGIAGGHVAVVERIEGNTIYMSENRRCWNTGSAWYWTMTKSQLANTTGFQGVIHNPYVSITPTTYTVTLSVSPPNSGTVAGGGIYNAGSTVTVQAYPNTDYDFLYWSNGNTNPRFSFTIQGNTSLTAYMRRKPKGKMVMINWDGSEIFIR